METFGSAKRWILVFFTKIVAVSRAVDRGDSKTVYEALEGKPEESHGWPLNGNCGAPCVEDMLFPQPGKKSVYVMRRFHRRRMWLTHWCVPRPPPYTPRRSVSRDGRSPSLPLSRRLTWLAEILAVRCAQHQQQLKWQIVTWMVLSRVVRPWPESTQMTTDKAMSENAFIRTSSAGADLAIWGPLSMQHGYHFGSLSLLFFYSPFTWKIPDQLPLFSSRNDNTSWRWASVFYLSVTVRPLSAGRPLLGPCPGGLGVS